MEALIVLLLVFLVCVLFIFPLWTFLRIRAQSDELDQLREQVRDLETTVRNRPQVAAVATPSAPSVPVGVPLSPAVTSSPGSIASTAVPVVAPPPPPPPVPATPAAPVVASPIPTPPPPPSIPPPLPPIATPAPAYTPPPPPPRRPTINWEQFMGVKLFLWLGGFALFLGAVFFVKLSIEQGWIPPEVRVALGFLLGVGLVAGGVILSRKRYAFQGQTLCATGIVTLYAMTTICTPSHLSYLGTSSSLGLMVLITAAAFLLAVRLNAQVVAILGMLGGFVTPILLSTGHDNPVGLFTYIALLDIGLIAVALHRRWHFLVPLAAIGTGIMQIGWGFKFLNNEKTDTAIVICLVFDALFLAGFVAAKRREQASSLFSLPTAGLVLLSFLFAWYLGMETPAGLEPGRWLSFVFLADLCILALVLVDVSAVRLHLVSGMAVFALLGGWTVDRVGVELLPWALAGYLVYAALHSAFPLVLHRVRADAPYDRWSQYFTPLALLLVLGPVLNSSAVSDIIWPAILLLDLLAIVLAWMTASLVSVVAVLLLTLIAAGQTVFRIPVSHTGGGLLLIIAGFAVLFFGAGLALAKRFGPLTGEDAGAGDSSKLATQLPALSSLLPFVLLVMAAGRLAMPSPSPVFGLALLLVGLTFGLSYLLAQGALPLCALGGVLALAYTWFGEHFRPNAPEVPMAWFVGFYLIFLGFPFAVHRRFAGLRGPWVASALAGPLFFPLFFGAIKRAWPNEMMGVLPAVMTLPAIGCVLAILRLDPADHPRRLGRLALFGGIALFFITLIFPIQFDDQPHWITISWALEGAAVLWLYHRVPHRGLPIAGVLLLGTSFVRLALNPAVLAYRLHSETPIFNGYLYSYGLVVLALLAGARLLAPPRERVFGLNAPAWLHAFAGILLFFLINIEIADYFGGQRSRLVFNFSSGSFAQDMSYTIAWALYAFGLLVVGVWKRSGATRYAALGLLTVAIAKLLIHDLARLGGLYRVGALMIVAVIAILASFIYQRFLPPDEKKSTPTS